MAIPAKGNDATIQRRTLDKWLKEDGQFCVLCGYPAGSHVEKARDELRMVALAGPCRDFCATLAEMQGRRVAEEANG